MISARRKQSDPKMSGRLGLRFDVKATDYLHRPAGSNTAANVTQALKTVANNRSDWGGGGFHFV
jgi:hypothetical protein